MRALQQVSGDEALQQVQERMLLQRSVPTDALVHTQAYL
jgi:hypothetical protein